jgi:hypothetical protein
LGWTIESVREADVDPGAVWALYADPASWSSWGHNATWARSEGPLVEGGIVDVRAGYGTVYHCRIRRLEPGQTLELVVRPSLLTIVNIYEVEPTSSGARVRHAFDVSGPLAGLTRLALARMYQRKLDDEVADVVRMAASPGEPASGARPAPTVSRTERVWHRLGRAMRGGREEQSG